MRLNTLEKPKFSPCHENLLEVTIPRKDTRYSVWYRSFPKLREELNLIHRHKELEIFYCPEDRGVYFINDRKYSIEPGDVFVVNSNEFHQPILKNPCKAGARAIYFDPHFLGADTTIQPWRSAFLFASRFGLHKQKLDPRAGALFSEFEGSFFSQNPGWAHLCRGILCHLLALIGDAFLTTSTNSADNVFAPEMLEFGRVVDYIMQHLDGPIEASALYRLAGLSKSQFSQKFKNLFGVSASHYILSERINRSMALLLSSTLSITEISLACGFNWLGYFNRAFKNQTGMSPSEYRISSRGLRSSEQH